MGRRGPSRDSTGELRLPLGTVATSPLPPSILAGALLVVVGAGLLWSPWAGLAALAIVGALAVAVHLIERRRRVTGWVRVGPSGVARVDRKAREVPLVVWGEACGVSLLANHARTEGLIAFTAPHYTRYLSIRPSDDGAARSVLAGAATVADADAIRDDAGTLSMSDAARLLEVLRAHVPLGRAYLSGGAGEQIVLDDGELRCGERVFDLHAGIEWRGFLFHESMGAVATVYQATWVRQSANEVVLVAPLPPEIAVSGRRDVLGHPSLVRDLKLMQSMPDAPPPRELRLAIERVFMLPLRQALDRAPRASRPAAPPSRLSSAHG